MRINVSVHQTALQQRLQIFDQCICIPKENLECKRETIW